MPAYQAAMVRQMVAGERQRYLQLPAGGAGAAAGDSLQAVISLPSARQ